MKTIIFPNLRQTYDYDCGASALQSVLVYYGFEVREDEIMSASKTDRKGTTIQGIINTVEKYGLKYLAKTMDIAEVKSFIDKAIPVIMVVQAWANKQEIKSEDDWDDSHYVVAIGYDAHKIYFADPSSFKTVFLKYKELKKRWHGLDINKQKYINYGLAIYGKKHVFDPKKIVHLD